MQQTTPTRFLRIERLVEVSRLLNQALELEPYLQAIVDYARELTASQASSIFIFEEETGLLKFVAAPRSQKESLKRIRVPLENSVAGRAYTGKKPLIIKDARLEPLVYREVDQVLDFETISILAVPIIYGDQALGVMEAINKLANAPFTDEDVILLETLASYAAIALFTTALLEEVHLAHQNLDDLERMKSDFIAIASHELRTPLGLILGHATFLQESNKDESLSGQIDVILRSATRLKEIIEQMSNLNAEKVGKARFHRSQVPVGQLVQEVCKSFVNAAHQKNITLTVEAPQNNLVVEADPEKIALALGNIIENALTFTDEFGHVWVRAERVSGHVRVSVIDNGIGIPSKDVHRVFDRFFQVESHATRHHGGMGLGLSVAKVMIEMHGGQIWAESVEGKGSNFSILLPAGSGFKIDK
jgi:signal transduction histidine kinase